MSAILNMSGSGSTASAYALSSGAEQRYANVMWFHAVNSQAALLEATQAISHAYFEAPGCGDAAAVNRGGVGVLLMPPCTAAGNSVFGIEADIQWHPTLETAVMRHDPVPILSESAPLPRGLARDAHGASTTSSNRESHNEANSPPSPAAPTSSELSAFTLEVFLYTLAEAAEGWRQRARHAAGTGESSLLRNQSESATAHAQSTRTAAAADRPLRVIVKLDFKAYLAAQQLLTHAEGCSWAGLEALCHLQAPDAHAAAANGEGNTSNISAASRRYSLRSVLNHVTDPAAAPPNASGIAAGATGAPTAQPAASPSHHTRGVPAAEVQVELWWNADVVAQSGAVPHPLSVAAAPAPAVQALMARTAHALGARIPLGFSLGWLLCPRAVPAEVLASASATVRAQEAAAAAGSVATTTASAAAAPPTPQYVFYNLLQDAPAMKVFLDGFWKALAATQTTAGQPPADPTQLVQLITFPMLFESVFADVYTAVERQCAFAASMPALASLTAAARVADEARRVASAVIAHAARLFSAPQVAPQPFAHRGGAAAGGAAASVAAMAAAPTRLVEDAAMMKHAATSAPPPESRAFPTFWKMVRPSAVAAASAAGQLGGAGRTQANVDRAARVFFPYCTIDG